MLSYFEYKLLYLRCCANFKVELLLFPIFNHQPPSDLSDLLCWSYKQVSLPFRTFSTLHYFCRLVLNFIARRREVFFILI